MKTPVERDCSSSERRDSAKLGGVMERFLVARNPVAESSLPYLVRLPLGDGIVLRCRQAWPRTAKVYCLSLIHI